MLEIKNVCKAYNKRPVLMELCLNIQSGEVIGIIGPNGVGKTTLVEAICGIVKLDSGEIILDGVSLTGNKLIRNEIGICFQESIFDRFFTIYETMVHVAMYHGYSLKAAKLKSNAMLVALGLAEQKNMMGTQLSGGMKKRFQVAIAMVSDPKVLILDEPTAGVDLQIKEDIYSLLGNFCKDNKKTVILIDHDFAEMTALCDRVVFIKNGGVVEESYINRDDGRQVEKLIDKYKALYFEPLEGILQ
jgi:ABC-2 type transport system ATP-binding protein